MLKEALLGLRNYIESEFDIPTYSDRMVDTDESKTAVVYVLDSDCWGGDEKFREFRFAVAIRYKLSEVSDDFTEVDAQEECYNIWERLITSPLYYKNMRLSNRSVQASLDKEKRYVIEMTFNTKIHT